jgi:hypothetical protein
VPRCDYSKLLDDTGRLNWTNGAGAFYLSDDGGVLTVTARATGQSFKVPPQLLDGAEAGLGWRIEDNWGEQQAKLANGAISVWLHQVAARSCTGLPIRDSSPHPRSASRQGPGQALRVQLSKRKAAPGTLAAVAGAGAAARAAWPVLPALGAAQASNGR